MIHFEIDSALFGIDEARRNLIAKDPQAQFALSQFGEAEHLLELVRGDGRAGRQGAVRLRPSVGHLALYFAVAV